MTRPETTSQFLARVIEAPGADRVALGEFVGGLGSRAFAFLILVLGLANCLPLPPPVPFVCGLLVLFVAVQLIIGRETPWLPAVLLRRSVERETLRRALGRAGPWLRRLERFARPRLRVFEGALGLRVVGIVLVVLALGLLAAPPFVGQIPLGLAVCLVGLGVVERDGVVLLAGVVVGSFALVLPIGFVLALVKAGGAMLEP